MQKNELDYKTWDMRTITLDDFSIELKITEKLWEHYKESGQSL